MCKYNVSCDLGRMMSQSGGSHRARLNCLNCLSCPCSLEAVPLIFNPLQLAPSYLFPLTFSLFCFSIPSQFTYTLHTYCLLVPLPLFLLPLRSCSQTGAGMSVLVSLPVSQQSCPFCSAASDFSSWINSIQPFRIILKF